MALRNALQVFSNALRCCWPLPYEWYIDDLKLQGKQSRMKWEISSSCKELDVGSEHVWELHQYLYLHHQIRNFTALAHG